MGDLVRIYGEDSNYWLFDKPYLASQPITAFAMNIGARIKEAAEEIGGLTRLGELINTPRRTVGNWVDGSTEPKASTVAEIALATGVSVKWLVLGLGSKFEEALYGGPSQTMGGELPMRQSFEPDVVLRGPEAFTAVIEIKRSPIEADALVKIHKAVRDAHVVAGIRLQEADALRIASNAYNDFVADQVDFADPEEVGARMVLFEKRLQKQINAARAEPGSGKRQA